MCANQRISVVHVPFHKLLFLLTGNGTIFVSRPGLHDDEYIDLASQHRISGLSPTQCQSLKESITNRIPIRVSQKTYSHIHISYLHFLLISLPDLAKRCLYHFFVEVPCNFYFDTPCTAHDHQKYHFRQYRIVHIYG